MEYVTLQTEEDNSRGATRHRDEDRIAEAKLELEEDASEAKREEKAYELAILGQP